jgi:hypothetical protein
MRLIFITLTTRKHVTKVSVFSVFSVQYEGFILNVLNVLVSHTELY